MRRGLLCAALALAGVLMAAPAHASGPAPYDGANPFVCTLQQLGQGTDFPQPDADPFCVEYDKTHQNVDQLGVVDFLSKEPARVAAASDKCFYFQRDHWTGFVSESAPQTQTYHWDGSYFFDKSRGTGGAYVENLSFNGQSGDPTQLPGFPPDWKPYFGQGHGGAQETGDVPVDPNCVAKAGKQDPHRPSTALPSAFGNTPCREAGGQVTTGIGGIVLGDTRKSVKQALGLPSTEGSRFVSYCFVGGGRLVAGFGPGDRAQIVITDATPFDTRGVRVGMSKANARRHLLGRKHLRSRAIRSAISVVNRKRRLVVGLSKGRVAYLAVTPRKLKARAVNAWLAQVPR
ncbi:MAG: hypothetical protein ACJ77M_11015 [Thermoleophilaceae bacterium]